MFPHFKGEILGTNYLKKLFKRTSIGRTQQWLIGVDDTTIVTLFGQVGGKLQHRSRPAKLGKLLERRSATGPDTLAQEEARSLWKKKKKAGYVENLKDAESGNRSWPNEENCTGKMPTEKYQSLTKASTPHSPVELRRSL